MAFKDSITMLDGERLSLTAKATVQSTGRLNFTPETATMMNLTTESTVILFAAGPRDLGAIVKPTEDRRGFKVKKSGPYFYINIKNHLEEQGIDYSGSTRVVYDITKLDETVEDLPLFKLLRRDIRHDPKVQEPTDEVKNALCRATTEEASTSTPSGENAPTAQENA